MPAPKRKPCGKSDFLMSICSSTEDLTVEIAESSKIKQWEKTEHVNLLLFILLLSVFGALSGPLPNMDRYFIEMLGFV